LIIFSTSIPKKGPGFLHARPQVNKNPDEEKSLLTPVGTTYNTWGVDLVNAGICVDLWFFPVSTQLELTTVSQLASMTGGDIHFFANFNPVKDTVRISHDLRHSLIRESGYNAVLRIRCSNGLCLFAHYQQKLCISLTVFIIHIGLTTHQQFGNFHMKNSTDIELAGIDQDKAIAFIVKHDEKLDTKLDASFQCAMLYTTAAGQRRVRVINLSLPVTDNIGSVFRSAQMDVTLNLLMKQGINLLYILGGGEIAVDNYVLY
jgi:protein transport protein SEC24